MIVGKQSILFEENVYIEETACVAGQKESEGPLGKLFDVVVEDAMAGINCLKNGMAKKKICVIFLQEICWGS